jgi:hypothetical protein
MVAIPPVGAIRRTPLCTSAPPVLVLKLVADRITAVEALVPATFSVVGVGAVIGQCTVEREVYGRKRDRVLTADDRRGQREALLLAAMIRYSNHTRATIRRGITTLTNPTELPGVHCMRPFTTSPALLPTSKVFPITTAFPAANVWKPRTVKLLMLLVAALSVKLPEAAN